MTADTQTNFEPRRWKAMFVLFLANFMNVMDATIVNVAIPSIEQDLHANSSQIEWVSAAYILAFALGQLPFGRLGDIIGRKAMFMAGVASFTLASTLCGIAPSIETLIGARILQGLGAAAMTPQVLAIVHMIFPPGEKGRAFAMFGVVSSVGSVAGPLVGGALIAANLGNLGWRPVFLVNIPLGLAIIAAGVSMIPRTPIDRGLRNDWAGIALFGTAILALIFPLIEGRAYGWPIWISAMVAVSAVFSLAFYFWERSRHRNGRAQLLPVSLLHNGRFTLGVLQTTLFFSGIPGLFLILAVFLQSGFGFDPLASGVATLGFPAGVIVASNFSHKLPRTVRSNGIAVGSVLFALGMMVMTFILSAEPADIQVFTFAVPLLLTGMGTGIAIASLFQSTLAAVPPHDAGSGSGALQTFQQVGSAVGIAIVGQIFFGTLETAQASGHSFVAAATNASFYEALLFGAVALLAIFVRLGNRHL